ncbi:MAG TPA: desulfoferrodoxin [Clostridia bacterium]|jgi:superoxide reductase|nr:desulfoferrodoxin [Clostridia bacterium]
MFGELLKTSEHEGREKHVPVIHAPAEVKAGEFFSVTVVVGEEVAHPNSPEHHIKWIQVFAHPEGSNPIQVANFDVAPGSVEPKVTFNMKLENNAVLYALAYCNIHGLWEAEFRISV